jgi:hypothetical protein
MKKNYASLLRKAMRSKDMTRRGLETALKANEKNGSHAYSYEHIRKILAGLPLMSEKFNEDVCAILGLDAAEMWDIAQREKVKKYGGVMATSMPTDQRLRTAWTAMTAADHERLIKIAEGMAAERTAEAANDDPEIIQQRIQRDMERLSVALRQPQQKTARR